jgi:hypothetical protein
MFVEPILNVVKGTIEVFSERNKVSTKLSTFASSYITRGIGDICERGRRTTALA